MRIVENLMINLHQTTYISRSRWLMTTFATGGIMLVICGAFGEMNKETHVMIIKSAKHAAANRDNSGATL